MYLYVTSPVHNNDTSAGEIWSLYEKLRIHCYAVMHSVYMFVVVNLSRGWQGGINKVHIYDTVI